MDCLFVIAPVVFSNVYLPVSMDCLFVIAPAVFSNVHLHLMTRFNVFYDSDYILMAVAYLLILHTNDSINMAEKKMVHISILFFVVLYLC